jgi:hypothetical protein
MAQQFATVEIWIVVDDCGDTATGSTAEEAREHFEEEIGSLSEREGFRTVKVSVRVPLPKTATLELEASVPELEAPAVSAS